MELYTHFIAQHPYLFSGALLVIVLLILLEFESKWHGIRHIGAAELSLLINREALIIDVNEDDIFAKGHILNAIHLPFSQWPQKITQFNQYKTQWLIIVANQERVSLNAAKMLRQQNFEKVGILTRGLIAWQEANLPLARK